MPSSEVAMVSAGRRRYGNTKNMKMFTLESPILVEFKR